MKTRVRVSFVLSLLVLCLVTVSFGLAQKPAISVTLPAPCVRGTFQSSRDRIPPNWSGPLFALSQQYPEVPPSAEAYPWKAFDFRTQPEAYLLAVRRYLFEGNVNPATPNAPWTIQNNPIRKWYHAPWLDAGTNGREFINGLTRELASVPGQLWTNPPQNVAVQNWAVGFYNVPGGYILGKVWCNPTSPTLTPVRFPEGTVSAKLLFTEAPLSQVPFLRGSVEWTANINSVPVNPRSPRRPQTMRLLQIDLAVRDIRNTDTGWVFGTLIYNPESGSQNPWERMQPVGVMWGDDPTVTPSNGLPIKETWLNPAVARLMQHYGWAKRLNGPVDNPLSSCHSCHATAGWPPKDLTPPRGSSDEERLFWFRNIRAGEPFATGQSSFDYSLQLAVGIREFKNANPGGPGPRFLSAPQRLRLPEINRAGTSEEQFRQDILRELRRTRRAPR